MNDGNAVSTGSSYDDMKSAGWTAQRDGSTYFYERLDGTRLDLSSQETTGEERQDLSCARQPCWLVRFPARHQSYRVAHLPARLSLYEVLHHIDTHFPVPEWRREIG